MHLFLQYVHIVSNIGKISICRQVSIVRGVDKTTYHRILTFMSAMTNPRWKRPLLKDCMSWCWKACLIVSLVWAWTWKMTTYVPSHPNVSCQQWLTRVETFLCSKIPWADVERLVWGYRVTGSSAIFMHRYIITEKVLSGMVCTPSVTPQS